VTKEIDVEEAKDWDAKEAALNDRYLRDRGRDVEADRAAELRGDSTDEVSPDDVPSGNIDQVLEWVGDDADRAKRALDAEEVSEKPRVSLMDSLETMLG
jgi:hypothetical protein